MESRYCAGRCRPVLDGAGMDWTASVAAGEGVVPLGGRQVHDQAARLNSLRLAQEVRAFLDLRTLKIRSIGTEISNQLFHITRRNAIL